MSKIIGLGEVLLDYVKQGNNLDKFVGGAILNFLAMTSKFAPSYLITCLGYDEDSNLALKTIKDENINCDFVKFNKDVQLAHSIASIDPITKDRSFEFDLEKASFLDINEDDINQDYFLKCDLFHIGSVILLNQQTFLAQLKGCKIAKENDALISFDPNFRPALFKKGQQEELVKQFLNYANIVKLGIDEISLISKGNNLEAQVKYLFDNYLNIQVILITLASKGMSLFLKDGRQFSCNSYKPDIMVDTIGCGDISYGTFIGCLFSKGRLTICDILNTKDDEFQKAIEYASKAGSLQCQHKSAFPIPKLKDIYNI